ncbi:MAG: hypothetical protein CVT88_05825 [Candidatus Altiarchaeales archaeon HGW-Altiarchaeales-1]|nr:MAG: hypothetical protein CVT88_05825 [Candidatus Altiarchaeales archaeon HGW-Altiarchaeales-1]
MEIKLDRSKTVHENAASYYEKAKHMREKIEGAKKALTDTLKKIDDLKKKKNTLEKNREISVKNLNEKIAKKRAKQWYENFRWIFIENFLVVGGKDATSNEILIKKHTEPNDLVMHADVFGSPFFVIKNGKNANDEILKNVASICASHSRAWKNGVGSSDVYCVNPEQVSKTAKAGEFLAKGSFMIYGERRWFRNTPLKIYICFKDGEILSTGIMRTDENGQISEQGCPHYVCLTPGTEKAKDLIKKIKKFYENKKIPEISNIPDDEIMRLIPYGQGQIIEMK